MSAVWPVRAGLLVAVAAAAQNAPDLDARLVMAVTAPEGGFCVIAIGTELRQGERLLAFAVPPAVAAGWSVFTTLTIGEETAECGLPEPPGPGQRFYAASADPDRVPDPAVIIALRDPPEFARVDATQAWADVDGDGQPEAFRACTSREGLHLSVWRGFPNATERIWHRYHYLGYDVEPTCDEPGRGRSHFQLGPSNG